MVRITWDSVKAESNWRKHGVRFGEARTIFYDPLLVCSYDAVHSTGEDRNVAVGLSLDGRLLVVSYTVREDEGRGVDHQRKTCHSGRQKALYGR
jgi:uncharacterized DUF497 family protein